MRQYNRPRAVIQVVNVDDLHVRILNVRYGEANRLQSVRRTEEAAKRNDKYSPHLETDRRHRAVSLGRLLGRHQTAGLPPLQLSAVVSLEGGTGTGCLLVLSVRT